MELLTSNEAFEKAIKGNDSILLLKHSLTCPISAEAKAEFEKTSANIPKYIIHVQDHREVSNYVADYFNIKHESPQVFYIKDGHVEFHASHWDVTSEKLEDIIK